MIENLISSFKKPPLISIIMPVYNCEKYLKECLDSLLEQTLKDIEIICIDDESTDNSYQILCDYKAKDKRIKIYKQKHSNAGNARNIGIQKSRGEYLLFLDSDDFFEKDLCSKTYNAAHSNDIDILLFGAYKYDNETKEKTKYTSLLDTKYAPLNEVFSPFDVKEHLYHITSAAPWCKLFKASFIKKNNIKFQPLSNANDVYFSRTAFALANKMYAIDEPLVNYRVNHGNNTQKNKYKDPLAFIRAYKKVKETLEKNKLFGTYYQTYMNVLITEIVYNYNTIQTEEGKKLLLDSLKNGDLLELGIDVINENLIYAHQKYQKYKEIMK